ncbi:PKD domain-containing protein [Flavihumibacter rivuli]|nr:PKD domain-containing protein [Flavihumibacter rivuli]ULQ58291.1 PKD domain-containing protein [Flavihumibacter rivuli]
MKPIVNIIILSLLTLTSYAQRNTNSLEFVENKGQWDKKVTFMGDLGNGAFFLSRNGFVVLQHNAEDLSRMASVAHGHAHDEREGNYSSRDEIRNKPGESGNIVLRSHAYAMSFDGMNPGVQVVGEKPQPTYNNYFLGDDPSKWASNCRIFNTVTYKNVYPNIDVRYFTDEGQVKYEFIVHPGGNPSSIVMQYDGVDKLYTKKGELVIATSVGDIREMPPYTYQSDGKQRKVVESRYQVKGNKVSFVLGQYDKNAILVIDPTLIFASFTGSRSDNWGYTATYGGDGSLYSGGIVFGQGFPVSTGAFQTSFNANNGQSPFNMGIMKLDPTGTRRIYATYLGGNTSDQPHSLIVDSKGDLIVAGRTSSSDYPLLPAGNRFGPNGAHDIILTKLNPTGTSLIGSMRIGGKGDDGLNTDNSHTGTNRGLLNFYGDDARSEVMIDQADNIYLASCTQSTDFFTTPNAPFKTLRGTQDAVLIKANSNLNNVLACTYFGGGELDAGYVLGINRQNGDIWIGGATRSSDFPGDKTGTIGPNPGGNSQADGFLAIFSNDGSVLKKSTYIGTNANDAVLGFEFDRDGDPYVMGVTYGQWQIRNAVYGTPGAKQFIGKLKPDLSDWQYTTTFGTNAALPNISPVAFLVDRCENIYVSGWGGTNLAQFSMAGTIGMQVTNDAIKRTTDNEDFYFIVIKRDASELLYATFFGQDGNFSEHVDGGTSRFDQNGVIYQAMCANCYSQGLGGVRPRFPVTPGAWCCSNGYSGSNGTGSGAECNLAMLKISFNFAGVGSGVSAAINGVKDTTGCVPLTVQLKDTVLNAQSYEWNFGDGSPDLKTTDPEVSHTYNQVGDFRVRLIAIDSTSCNIRDTSFLTIRVRADQALLDFNAVKLLPCESLSFRFDNLSTAPAGKPFSGNSFIWDFGDGTRVVSGPGNVNHSYASAGTYKVKLILTDTVYCNAPDSLERDFNLAPLVKAQFEADNGCAPFNASFVNTSIAGQTYLWDFGDGTSSTEKDPVKLFANPGTYRVKLKVFDSNTCNLEDSTFQDIVVSSAPTAGFSFAPVVPVENTPTTFTNTSSPDAVRFVWSFGDGDGLETTSRVPIQHQYNATGRFNACLIAINRNNCADTLCLDVDAIVVPKVDLPNAFTPNGPAPNNQVFVRGYAIGRMKLMIFNRLGQKVFETNSTKIGWDGKFNGVLQPMDVYAYVLEVEFTDGTRTTKKGDITLIR